MKNIAILQPSEMGSGKILFNLDADNFIDNSLEHLVNLKENELAHNPPT